MDAHSPLKRIDRDRQTDRQTDIQAHSAHQLQNEPPPSSSSQAGRGGGRRGSSRHTVLIGDDTTDPGAQNIDITDIDHRQT